MAQIELTGIWKGIWPPPPGDHGQVLLLGDAYKQVHGSAGHGVGTEEHYRPFSAAQQLQGHTGLLFAGIQSAWDQPREGLLRHWFAEQVLAKCQRHWSRAPLGGQP